MNATDIRSIHSIEFEGMFYVETADGVLGKGCQRCGGTGHYMFNGSDDICYACGNVFELRLGDVFDTREQAEKWCHVRAMAKANRDRKREAERLAKLARRQSVWDDLAAAHPAVWTLLAAVSGVDTWLVDGTTGGNGERDSFVLNIADRLWSLDERALTERQIAVIQKIVDKRAAKVEEAAATPVVTGRVLITGVVRSAKRVETSFGDADKILVQDDRGFRVWGTLARDLGDQAYDEWIVAVEHSVYSVYDFGSAVWLLGCDTQPGDNDIITNGAVIGRRISFTATVEASKNDAAFGFFSRPVKGIWVAE